MNLGVYERLVLLSILPAEGDLTTLRIVRDLRGNLSFSEEEHEALGIEFLENSEVRWRKGSDEPKEIEIGPRAKQVIVDSFEALDKRKQLRMEHLDLYERFLGEKTELRAVAE